MRLQNFGKFTIPFVFSGKTYKLNVTKYSTCNDVIHMILHKSGFPISQLNSFGLFEKTISVERLLPDNTLVHKIWRSWGSEKYHFKFVVKTKESVLKTKTDNLCTSKPVECDIDALYTSHYRKMDSIANVIHNTEGDITEYTELSAQNSSRKDIQGNCTRQLAGKQMVLARYLYDIYTVSSIQRQGTPSTLGVRENGDGEDSVWSRLARGCDAVIGEKTTIRNDSNDVSSFDSFNECKADQTDDLQEIDDTATLEFYASRVTLDTAFVKGSCDSDSDEGIDVTSVDSVDLDAAFIGEKANFNDDFEFDIELHNEDDRVGYKARQMDISRDNAIKRLFVGEQLVISEDDEMESFMHSRIES